MPRNTRRNLKRHGSKIRQLANVCQDFKTLYSPCDPGSLGERKADIAWQCS